MNARQSRLARVAGGSAIAALFVATVASAAYATPHGNFHTTATDETPWDTTTWTGPYPTFSTPPPSPSSPSPTSESPSPTSESPSPTSESPSPTPPANAHKATIVVVLSLDPEPGAEEPPVTETFSVTDAVIGDGVELNGHHSMEDTVLGCTAAAVDISTDLKSVDIGVEGPRCRLTGITVTITIGGVTFVKVTPGADSLFFNPEDMPEAAGGAAPGHLGLSRHIPAALTPPYPVLTSATASGSTLTLVWHGTRPARAMAGASFSLTLGAPGAKAASGQPVFTG